MKSLKRILHSWLSAGVIVYIIWVGSYFLSEQVLAGPFIATSDFYFTILMAGIFLIPSILLNWLYDKQGHSQTQREWIKSPKGLIGKIGYILTGSVALWGLLFVGILLASLVIGGLLSLGQAAWST